MPRPFRKCPASSVHPAIRRFLQRQAGPLVLALLALAMAGFTVIPIYNYLHAGWNKDYPVWYRAGQRVIHGGDLYEAGPSESADAGYPVFDYMYPPFPALVFAPLTVLGPVSFITLLALVNTVSWIIVIVLAVYLATGKVRAQHPLLYLVAGASCIVQVADMFLLGQPNLFLLACLLGAFTCLRLQRSWVAGALVALAAAIKAFPILALGYLVYRRQWKATLSTLVFLTVFLVLIPTPVRGFHRNLADLATWSRGMVFRYDKDAIGQRPRRAYGWKNQSLIPLANRWLRKVDCGDSTSDALYINVMDLDFRTVNGVIAVVALGLGLYYVACTGRARCPPPRDAAEYAMLLVLIVMFSPMAYPYYFVWLLFPFTVALQMVRTAPSPSRRRVATVTWFLACLVLYYITPDDVLPWSRRVQAWGNVFLGCVLLLIGLGWEARRTRLGLTTPGLTDGCDARFERRREAGQRAA